MNRMTYWSKRISLVLLIFAGCTLKWKGATNAQSVAATEDEGSTSKMHEQHVNTIVFAKQEIPRDGSVATLAKEFRADEPIWSRYFLSKSFAKHLDGKTNAIKACKWENRRRINVFTKVGDEPESRYEGLRPGPKSWSYWTTAQATHDSRPLLPEDSVFLPQGRSKNGARLLLQFAMLPAGSYPVTMRIEASCLTGPKTDVAVGSFTVLVDQKARETLKAQLKIASSSFTDHSQVARLSESARRTFSKRTIKDFRVIEPAWRVTRNDLGVPIERHITGLTYTQQDNKCMLVGSDIRQTNQGGAAYGSPEFLRPIADDRLSPLRVPCDLEGFEP